MRKFILALVFIGGFAVLAAFTPPDSGTSADENVISITFTNGWSIICVTNTLVFVAP